MQNMTIQCYINAEYGNSMVHQKIKLINSLNMILRYSIQEGFFLTCYGIRGTAMLFNTLSKAKSCNPKACNEFGNKSSRFFQIQKTTSLVAPSYHNLAVVLMVLPVASSPENPFKDRAFLNINDNPP